ncbi:MAG: VOC family protein [Sphingomonadales bacterium]|nr:VOC family protein [Sphingomonadales bacterium]MDE2570325.1 VOC family protein [Sphingomonadales bacterium]
MSLLKVVDIAHVRFSAPDLAQMRGFLDDFGLATFEQDGRLYARGTDGRPFVHVTEPGEPAFLAIGFRAASVADLDILAKAEGVIVEDSTEPGGGKIVRLTDPDGFRVEVLAGQVNAPCAEGPADPPRNTAAHRGRLRQTVRLVEGPAHVRRIGHGVLNVSDFRKSEAWYKARFGFLTSDEVEAAKDVPLGAFMRCDRGDKPSDHHTLFLAQLPQKPGFLHAAFEVANMDDLMLGHAHLKARGRTQAWGVGRHIMGSQIFDYWKDPWGHEMEHWTDGDLLTADDPPARMPLSALLAVQWGAPHPMFAGKRAPPQKLVTAFMVLNLRIRRLFRRSPKVQPA